MRVAVAGWRALIADLQTMPPSKASERTTRKHALSGAVGPGATSPPVCSLTHAGSFAAGGAGGGGGRGSTISARGLRSAHGHVGVGGDAGRGVALACARRCGRWRRRS